MSLRRKQESETFENDDNVDPSRLGFRWKLGSRSDLAGDNDRHSFSASPWEGSRDMTSLSVLSSVVALGCAAIVQLYVGPRLLIF